jgi:hypothetical protein
VGWRCLSALYSYEFCVYEHVTLWVYAEFFFKQHSNETETNIETEHRYYTGGALSCVSLCYYYSFEVSKFQLKNQIQNENENKKQNKQTA